MTVRYTTLARQQLKDIWRHDIETRSHDEATAYLHALNAAAETLDQISALGRPILGRSGAFRHNVKGHLLLFERTLDGVLVLQVLRQSMDLDARLYDDRD